MDQSQNNIHMKSFTAFPLLIILLIIPGCMKSGVDAEFVEIRNGSARFDLVNYTGAPVSNIELEIKILSDDGSPILTDTTSYISTERNGTKGPFMLTDEETFFMRSMPENASSCTIRVLRYNY